MKLMRFSKKSVPIVFAIVTVVAYGLLLPFTGFYWDDWPFAWIAKFLGPGEFFPAFNGVRPFLSPIFFITTSLIPPVPIYWQIFALTIRFISGLSAWFVFNQIWPQRQRQALITALLFLVFPGYSQHWVAFTHINQEWIPFIFYLLSFGFSLRALRKARSEKPKASRRNKILALFFLVVGVFPTEYLVSLEPLRSLFIWVVIAEETSQFKEKFIQSLKHWLPYLLIWLANGAWLAYFYTLGNYDSYTVEVVKEPMTISRFFASAGDAIWKAGVYVWGQVIVLSAKTLSTPSTLLTWVLIFIACIGIYLYIARFNSLQEDPKAFAVPALIIGFAGILLGRIPSFAAGLPLKLQASNDRFMISMMLGGSIFVSGLVVLLIRNFRVKTYIFALLIALGIGQQFFNANIFRRDWEKQQEIFWQMAWRVPALKHNTAILTDYLPLDYESDTSISAPINWMYAPDYTRSDVPYAVIYLDIRLNRSDPSPLEKNPNFQIDFRTVSFLGTTSQAIVIYMPPTGCLRVLDPTRNDQNTYSKQSRLVAEAVPYSDLSNIIMDANQTAKLPFLSEPKHTWCYYYEKSELAYQKRDWNRVIDLIDKARSLGYAPNDQFEWLTYIEAQAMTGNIQDAQKLSEDALARDGGVRLGLCEIWKRVQVQSPVRSEMATKTNQIILKFHCTK